jgi:hypothetical protein
MIIVSNEKLIRRNGQIAKFTGLAGLVVLGGGIFILVTQPENYGVVWATVLAGFLLSQVGIYFTNRWGRRPRPDEHINLALKGLGESYSLYHYTTPTPHVLIGPAGIWVLLPHYQRGTIIYENGRWRQKGGGFLLGYMKMFGQEGLGRLDVEIEGEIGVVKKFLTKCLPDTEIPPIQAALLFTDERVELLNVDDATTPTLQVKKLKELIRKAAKGKPISPARVKDIQDAVNLKIGFTKDIE